MATPPDRKLRCDNSFSHDALHSVARPSSSRAAYRDRGDQPLHRYAVFTFPAGRGEGRGMRADDNLAHVVSTWALPVLGWLVSTANSPIVRTGPRHAFDAWTLHAHHLLSARGYPVRVGTLIDGCEAFHFAFDFAFARGFQRVRIRRELQHRGRLSDAKP